MGRDECALDAAGALPQTAPQVSAREVVGQEGLQQVTAQAGGEAGAIVIQGSGERRKWSKGIADPVEGARDAAGNEGAAGVHVQEEARRVTRGKHVDAAQDSAAR